MRRYIGIMILLLVALFLTSCSSGTSTQPEQPTSEPPVVSQEPAKESESTTPVNPVKTSGEGKLSEVYQKMMKSGRYTMKYKTIMDMDGNEVEMEITMAVMDGMSAMVMDSDMLESITINRDGNIYIISHENKTMMVLPEGTQMETEEESITPVELGEYTMEYAGSGKEDFMGKERKYEEYVMEEGKVKYYFDGNDLEGISSSIGEHTTLMEIEEMSDTVDETLFELPLGYQEIKLGS